MTTPSPAAECVPTPDSDSAQLDLDALRCAVEVWPDPALLAAPNGSVLAASPGALVLAGLTGAGRPNHLSDVIGDAAAERLLAARHSDAPPRQLETEADLEARVTHLSGGHLLVALSDTVPERRLRMHLNQAERLASIGELLSSVAHELTNPLTSVLGYAELLLTEDDAPHEEIRRIRNEAVRCRRIVSNLLDLARAEPLKLEPLSLQAVVEKVMEFRRYASNVRQVELLAETDANLPPVDGDFHRLVQAILNLVTNAEHAVAGRASERRVIVRTCSGTGHARLEVEDNGPGVPSEIRRTIFQPFFTTKPRGKGTGLGLSLVRATVESHGGAVHVEDGTDGGARFVITLPFADGSVPTGAPRVSLGY